MLDNNFRAVIGHLYVFVYAPVYRCDGKVGGGKKRLELGRENIINGENSKREGKSYDEMSAKRSENKNDIVREDSVASIVLFPL